MLHWMQSIFNSSDLLLLSKKSCQNPKLRIVDLAACVIVAVDATYKSCLFCNTFFPLFFSDSSFSSQFFCNISVLSFHLSTCFPSFFLVSCGTKGDKKGICHFWPIFGLLPPQNYILPPSMPPNKQFWCRHCFLSYSPLSALARVLKLSIIERVPVKNKLMLPERPSTQ